MQSDRFRVQRLDHVHVFVSDRAAAVAWYAEVLGLEKRYDYTEHGDPRGPIVLSSDGGETHLALFERRRQRPSDGPGSQTVAFRVAGAGFLRFLGRLADLDLRGAQGARVMADDLVDHGNSYSIYFCDPDGNPYEITTYDHGVVRGQVARSPGS
jgi:catechol 2,3-dioxygenase-like lactoylglutathione lyase family enzyme